MAWHWARATSPSGHERVIRVNPNEIRSGFQDLLESRQAKWLPETTLLSSDPETFFTISTFLKVKPFVVGRVIEPLRLATAQRCLRGKPELLAIVGREGIATVFSSMMSFFLLSEAESFLGEEVLLRFLGDALGLSIDNLYCVAAVEDQASIDRIVFLGIPPDHIVLVPAACLKWELPSTANGLVGRYIRFFKRHASGLAPVGDLNRIRTRAGTEVLIDSSFLIETLTVVTEDARHLYATPLFAGSLRQLAARDPAGRLDVRARWLFVNLLRAVVAALADGALPSANGAGFLLRKLLRTAMLTADVTAGAELWLPAVAAGSFEDLAYLGYEWSSEEQTKAFGILGAEARAFQKLVQRARSWLPREITRRGTITNDDLAKWKESRGIPEELARSVLHELGVAAEPQALSLRTAVPMYPLDDRAADWDARDWLYRLHAQRLQA